MSQQLQITGGAKVRNLEGVLTGTSGVVNALGINVPSGIPQLDGSGKILVSQLPNSVMEYKGTWNVSTNTPTLVNGVGNQGDVYLVEGAAVGGTAFNFGAGPITFFNGDQVVYSGSIWQRASGSTGTVTSVAVSRDGDALSITGSPITTAGTINIGFTGSNAQYINGEGDLVTFPSLTGFVPYTGATADVDLGVNFLKARTFYAEGNGGGGSYAIKNGATPSFEDGYTILSSNDYRLNILSTVSTITKAVYLGFSDVTATRTYTLPDLSGTLALLEGTQTFTGNKRFDTGVLIKNGVSPSASGYTGIGAGTSGITVNLGSGGGGYLIFQSTSYDYTFPAASGTLALTSDIPSLTGYVPYTGATANVNLGTFDLTADVITGATGSFASSGGSNTFAINHSSGSGIALNITKGGNGEGIYINKTSGSGNAATIIGTLNATTLVKNGGTSSQFLKADGSVDSNSYVTIDTTQTITGVKTFGSSVTINTAGQSILSIVSSAGNSSDITSSIAGVLKSTISTSATEFKLISAIDNILKFQSSTNFRASLIFSNTADYSYTYPNASGTLALTSDLSGYVTIGTTQTITGAKTFSLDILVNSVKIGNANGSNLNTVVGFGALTGSGVENTAVGYLTLSNNTTGNGNTAVGKRALINNTTANYNTAIGAESLFSNTTGSNNTGVGYYSLFGNTTGVFNTALGSGALASNTTGVSNTAIGANSLLVNTTGNNNTAIGTDSLNVNTTGSRNTAIGYYALNANTIANNNTAIGYYTLVNNTTGGENLGVGNEALRFNTVGDNNVAIGNQSQRLNVSGSFNTTMGVGSLYNNTTGTYNIAIGYNSATSITTGSNNTIIGGYVGTAAMSNNIVLADGQGNVRYQWNGTNTLLGQSGNVGIGTTAPLAKVTVRGGNLGNSVSMASTVFSVQGNDQGIFMGSYNGTPSYGSWIQAGREAFDIPFNLVLQPNGGNVGIGTSSPSGKLSLYDTSDLWLNIAKGSSFVNIGVDSTGTFYNTNSNHRWLYNSGSNEAMRVTADGDLLVGTTISLNGGGTDATNGFRVASNGTIVNNSTADANAYFAKRSGYSSSTFVAFYVAGTYVGAITTNGSATSYTTASDYRLKQDLKEYNGLDLLSAIKTYDYEWKSDKTRMYGVVAHELQQIIPYAVTGEKDGKDMQGVDYSKLVPILVKSIQELEARIKQLENK
jgi:hypothetical protein